MKLAARFSVMCVATALAVSSLVLPANAATNAPIRKQPDGINWSREWERTTYYLRKSDGLGLGEMTYGYDTDWINEDYVWTKGYYCKGLN